MSRRCGSTRPKPWWIWYYGSGFGARVYVEHYTVFALPLAFMLDRWQGWRRMAAITFLVFASALQLAQCYQYNHVVHVQGRSNVGAAPITQPRVAQPAAAMQCRDFPGQGIRFSAHSAQSPLPTPVRGLAQPSDIRHIYTI